MKEFTAEELQPFKIALRPLQGLTFSAAVSPEAWRQLAIALADVSADAGHARRIVESFVRCARYDGNGMLKTDVPSSIELRMFAREVPRQEIPSTAPEPCEKCADFPGWEPVEIAGSDYRRICTCERGQWQAIANGAMRKTK